MVRQRSLKGEVLVGKLSGDEKVLMYPPNAPRRKVEPTGPARGRTLRPYTQDGGPEWP